MSDDLETRNAQLASLLAEARDQLVTVKEELDIDVRSSALLDCFDYLVIAVDLRIAELRTSIMRNVVGEVTDYAQRLPPERLPEIFLAALRARGFDVTPYTEPDGAA